MSARFKRHCRPGSTFCPLINTPYSKKYREWAKDRIILILQVACIWFFLILSLFCSKITFPKWVNLLDPAIYLIHKNEKILNKKKVKK